MEKETAMGYKSLKESEYEALREYCYRNRLKHSPVIREALADKLRKEGYLKKESKAQ